MLLLKRIHQFYYIIQIHYSFALSVSDSYALATPRINISRAGIVPRHEQVFKMTFGCKKGYNAEVDINIYLNLTLESSPENVTSLILKRKKICFTSVGSGDVVDDFSSLSSTASSSSPHLKPKIQNPIPNPPIDVVIAPPVHHHVSPTVSGGDFIDSEQLNVQPVVPPIDYSSSGPTRDEISPPISIGQIPSVSTIEPNVDNNPVYIAVACAIGFIIILSLILYLCYLLIQRCFCEGSSLHSNGVNSLTYPHSQASYYQGHLEHPHYYYTGIPSSTTTGTLIRSGKNSTQINPYINGTLYGKEATGSLKTKSIKSNATASSHKQSDYSVVSFIYQDLEQGTYFV